MSIKTIVALLVTFAGISAAQASAQDMAKLTYTRIPAPEYYVLQTHLGEPMLGVGIHQKTAPGGNFCRQFVVIAPEAQPTYACYTAVVNGQEARDTYERSRSAELMVAFYLNNQPLVGSRWGEKQVVIPRFGTDPLLCIKTAPVVPNPVFNYTCFTPGRPPLGGAVSVGN